MATHLFRAGASPSVFRAQLQRIVYLVRGENIYVGLLCELNTSGLFCVYYMGEATWRGEIAPRKSIHCIIAPDRFVAFQDDKVITSALNKTWPPKIAHIITGYTLSDYFFVPKSWQEPSGLVSPAFHGAIFRDNFFASQQDALQRVQEFLVEPVARKRKRGFIK